MYQYLEYMIDITGISMIIDVFMLGIPTDKFICYEEVYVTKLTIL